VRRRGEREGEGGRERGGGGGVVCGGFFGGRLGDRMITGTYRSIVQTPPIGAGRRISTSAVTG